MEKTGRNDPCPCGSGKKFKKCCELKTQKKSIGSAAILTGSSPLSSFFQRKIAPLTPPSLEKLEKEVPPEDKRADL